jgi:hypothetical protein
MGRVKNRNNELSGRRCKADRSLKAMAGHSSRIRDWFWGGEVRTNNGGRSLIKQITAWNSKLSTKEKSGCIGSQGDSHAYHGRSQNDKGNKRYLKAEQGRGERGQICKEGGRENIEVEKWKVRTLTMVTAKIKCIENCFSAREKIAFRLNSSRTAWKIFASLKS